MIQLTEVATSTFRHVFLSDDARDLEAKIVHLDTPTVLEQIPEVEGYLKFSFVRNPWGRVLSCYRNKVERASVIGHLTIMSRFTGLRPGMRFEEFVEWLATPEGSDERADRHWISQHRLLAGADGYPACDYIGRHENLEADFGHVCELIGLPPATLPVVHRTSDSGTSSRPFYKDFYGKRTRQVVADRYARDIELFDYDF